MVGVNGADVLGLVGLVSICMCRLVVLSVDRYLWNSVTLCLKVVSDLLRLSLLFLRWVMTDLSLLRECLKVVIGAVVGLRVGREGAPVTLWDSSDVFGVG